jgi:NAD(P)H dehydrogenase (quinone)
MGFPALHKGWIERVFAYSFTYSLTAEGWSGHVKGRVPLLKHKKALVISTTFFTEEDYREEGFDRSIETIVDHWTLRYPGVQTVEHAYFHAVRSVSNAVREDYLNQAYKLGKAF